MVREGVHGARGGEQVREGVSKCEEGAVSCDRWVAGRGKEVV